MTTDKARKRAVRSRMEKTGERYAAARRHVVTEARASDPEVVDAVPRPEIVDVVSLEAASTATAPASLPPQVADPGLSDEAILKGTGRDWDAWFRDLDAWGAATRTHTEIARHVSGTYPIGGWWAQSVTVGYERARGMRAVHQTTRGFEVSVSRTLPAPPDIVWPWLAEERNRDVWIEPGFLRIEASREGRWTRFSVEGDDTSVRLILDPKGDDRAVVTVVHARLGGTEDVAAQRAAWRPRLEALRRAIDGDGVRTRVGPR